MSKFEEAQLNTSFCSSKVTQAKEIISSEDSFTVIGLPAMGISIFLKYLACQDFAHFVHVNVYELEEMTKDNFLKLLLKRLGGEVNETSERALLDNCRNQLEKMLKRTDKKVVIVFNRFDNLVDIIDELFISNLRSLRDVDKQRLTLVFAACRPLTEVFSKAILGNLSMFSKQLYLQPYSQEDMKEILRIKEADALKNPRVNKIIKLSGGHYGLLQVLLKSQALENPLIDYFVRLQLKDLYEFLDYKRKKLVEKAALGKQTDFLDPYLLDIGMVVKSADNHQLFTPILAEYVKNHSSIKLPVKEKRLFQLLSKNLDQVVSKDLIYQQIWKNEDEGSEWALNALIYRLRKNPFFVSQGYIIENHKKEGYVMYKG